MAGCFTTATTQLPTECGSMYVLWSKLHLRLPRARGGRTEWQMSPIWRQTARLTHFKKWPQRTREARVVSVSGCSLNVHMREPVLEVNSFLIKLSYLVLLPWIQMLKVGFRGLATEPVVLHGKRQGQGKPHALVGCLQNTGCRRRLVIFMP